MNSISKEERNKKYNEYVKQVTPKKNLFVACSKAFLSGGLICTIGQAIMNAAIKLGASKEDSALYTIIILVLVSVILTGVNVYPKMAKWCGAGTLVPITGFANSVVSAAMEFRKEGMVFGMGSRLFQIAGPVILYGIVSSSVLGFFYWLWTLM